MKYFVLLSVAVCGFLFMESCGKKEKAPGATIANVTPGVLAGRWELRHIAGGYSAGGPGNFAAGNGIIYEFSDSSFRYLDKQKIVAQGGYKITQDTFYDGTIMDRIIMDQQAGKVFIKLKDTQFILYRGIIAADGTEETFEKIADAPAVNK